MVSDFRAVSANFASNHQERVKITQPGIQLGARDAQPASVLFPTATASWAGHTQCERDRLIGFGSAHFSLLVHVFLSSFYWVIQLEEDDRKQKFLQ